MANEAAALNLIKSIYETIKECGADGCPAGVLYSTLMEHGCTLDQYQSIESLLLDSGMVRKSSDCLFAVPGF